MNKKFLIRIGILAVLVMLAVGALVFLSAFLFTINPIVPIDVKIVQILEKNKNYLLGIEGVLGAGIARNQSDNSIVGIAV